tara:strand:- start:3765 stop:4904 length:1140 start_codon:yes stop_codon:yes gene_type:complete
MFKVSSYNKILYIFGSGRKEKILTSDLDSSEFFYGYFHMKSKFKDIDSIEMLPNGANLSKYQSILEFFDKVFRKLTNLPFYIHLIQSKNNFSKINNADLLISTNDRIAISVLPMVILSKFRSGKKKFVVIVMGLFSKKRDRKIVYFLQTITLKFIIKKINYLIFLGKGEYLLANKMFPKFNDKFKFIPFGINLNFWTPSKNYTAEENDYILFVGNDGNRDFDKVIEIGNSLKDINIKIITSQKISKQINNKNVELIYGNWHNSALTDQELKEYYENAILTFIPLKETFQPSGQSVALQSMSLGVPVVMTQTKGFWDVEKFNHLENIVFVNDNKIDNWNGLLSSLVKEKNLLNLISKNSIETVRKYYNQNDFFTKMEGLI